MKYQAVMKKIHFLLRKNGVGGSGGGSIDLDLVLDSNAPFPLESEYIIISKFG